MKSAVARDAVMPSFHNAVSVAALRAMGMMAASLQPLPHELMPGDHNTPAALNAPNSTTTNTSSKSGSKGPDAARLHPCVELHSR